MLAADITAGTASYADRSNFRDLTESEAAQLSARGFRLLGLRYGKQGELTVKVCTDGSVWSSVRTYLQHGVNKGYAYDSVAAYAEAWDTNH